MSTEKRDTGEINAGFSFYDLLETEPSHFSSIDPIQKLEETLKRLSTGRFSLNPEIVKQFSTQLSLGFDQNRNAEGNVCFANREDVRPEYRLTFGYTDLVNYLYAVLDEPTYRMIFKDKSAVKFPLLPYPKDPADFWQLVQKGSTLSQNHLCRSKQ
jgi:hypothetical protein